MADTNDLTRQRLQLLFDEEKRKFIILCCICISIVAFILCRTISLSRARVCEKAGGKGNRLIGKVEFVARDHSQCVI